MAKFSRVKTQLKIESPLRTTDQRRPTYEGGLGFARDAESELFLLAVCNMVSESTFYERADERDERYRDLIRRVAREDPEWIAGFLPYLRNVMQMRSASIVLAAEYVRVGGIGARQVVASALQRADEPAEILAYWTQAYGKRFPQPLKRGVADAVRRLYTERAALKYDGSNAVWRMGDVIDLCHPRPASEQQSALFKWLLDRRHDRAIALESLPAIRTMMQLEAIPVEERRAFLKDPAVLATAGMTWERLSGWLQGKMDAEAWTAMIPSMGYMALLRNLRNVEQTGVPGAVLDAVAQKLADPEEIAASRQFPIRFYSAYRNLRTERFSFVLEQAVELSLRNVPELPGRTLILVDCSGSMEDTLSARSNLRRREVAALFGLALAKRAESYDLYAYGDHYTRVKAGGPILRTMAQFGNMGGTLTWQTLERTHDGHERVVIITDEQAFPYRSRGVFWGRGRAGQDGYGMFYDRLPELKAQWTYTFNVAGYVPAHHEQGRNGSYVFGGLTDAGFAMIPMLEELRDGQWPWLRVA